MHFTFHVLTCILFVAQDRNSLRRGLAGLPAPRNDYEIVIPEQDAESGASQDAHNFIEDQADVDARRDAEIQAQRMYLYLCLCFNS